MVDPQHCLSERLKLCSKNTEKRTATTARLKDQNYASFPVFDCTCYFCPLMTLFSPHFPLIYNRLAILTQFLCFLIIALNQSLSTVFSRIMSFDCDDIGLPHPPLAFYLSYAVQVTSAQSVTHLFQFKIKMWRVLILVSYLFGPPTQVCC